MKYLKRLATYSVVTCALVTANIDVARVTAAPVFQDKAELERMIMERIEEKKKELKARKAKGELERMIVEEIKANKKELAAKLDRNKASAAEGNSKKIRLDFVDKEWNHVIETVAQKFGAQANFKYANPPNGTLTYSDSSEHGIEQCVSLLNGMLADSSPSLFLVSSNDELVLLDEAVDFPNGLIDVATLDDLAQYGEYDVVRCVFDLSDLYGDVFANMVREDVGERHLSVIGYAKSAGVLVVRERVRNLRRFGQMMKQTMMIRSPAVGTSLQRYPAEGDVDAAYLAIKRIVEEEPEAKIDMNKADNTIYVKGSYEIHKKVLSVLKMQDIGKRVGSSVRYLQTHPISDPELSLQIVEPIVDGKAEIRLEKMGSKWGLSVYGVERVHEMVLEALRKTSQ